MRIVITISILLTLIFSTLLAFTIINSATTEIERDITLEAPVPVVYKFISESDNYNRWSPMILSIHQQPQSLSREVVYRFVDKELEISESVLANPQQNKVVFKQKKNGSGAFIGNFQNEIQIERLADGSTSINWKIRYTCFTFGTQLLNSFLIKPKINTALNQHLQALQNLIEH